MTVKRNQMGRWFVAFWLLVVVLTMAGMQAFLFGMKGLDKFGWRGGKSGGSGASAPATTPGGTPPVDAVKPIRHIATPVNVDLSLNDRYRAIKVGAGTLHRMEVMGGGAAGVSRDILIWLPPGYDDEENRKRMYPVLYLMDGQNVFEKRSGASADWQADETAATLIEQGKIEPLIIVGIPSADAAEARSHEYLPLDVADKAGSHATEFVRFLIEEVRPRVERGFRVKAGPESTGVGGESQGAIIAMEAATEHPEVFGKVLCENMPVLNKEHSAFKYFAAKKRWPAKVVFGTGAVEAGKDSANSTSNRRSAAMASAFKELAQGKGLGPDRFMLTIDEGGGAGDGVWAKRLGPALEFLFPARQ